MSISTKQIGDGKLPNKFWVSISEDYMYFDSETGSWNWISDVIDFKPKGETIKVFDSYVEARDFVDCNLFLGSEYCYGMFVNCVTIEDRITGQVYENTKFLDTVKGEINDEETEDTSFTEERDPNFK